MGTRLLFVFFNSLPGCSSFLYLSPAAKHNSFFLPPPFSPTRLNFSEPTQNTIQMQVSDAFKGRRVFQEWKKSESPGCEVISKATTTVSSRLRLFRWSESWLGFFQKILQNGLFGQPSISAFLLLPFATWNLPSSVLLSKVIEVKTGWTGCYIWNKGSLTALPILLLFWIKVTHFTGKGSPVLTVPSSNCAQVFLGIYATDECDI